MPAFRFAPGEGPLTSIPGRSACALSVGRRRLVWMLAPLAEQRSQGTDLHQPHAADLDGPDRAVPINCFISLVRRRSERRRLLDPDEPRDTAAILALIWHETLQSSGYGSSLFQYGPAASCHCVFGRLGPPS
jgi:hypothetical protein